MINKWTSELKNAVEKLQINYSLDNKTIINEDDLKFGIRQNLHNVSEENDMLIKPEVPWYDESSENKQVKFYFDLAILKKSIFNLEFRNATMNNKGYYYNDISLAIMLKFAKPNFNLSEIGEDLDKLKLFSIQTANDAKKQKPVLVIGCSDVLMYDKASEVLAKELKRFSDDFLKRAEIIIFSPNKIEIL
ncbi:hypothetical protein [Flavobacterium cyclinae]|uniref:hypothetical protein n=1 Tax=Flavobacterium cyclinae TaxID=2895947 RepID=UPI001E28D71D|nr:hypothetical protein [Flavobacterium cyclinae]UGS22339.1 hypothetical protein LOS86_06865 [Flavobacterium cyclinae]